MNTRASFGVVDKVPTSGRAVVMGVKPDLTRSDRTTGIGCWCGWGDAVVSSEVVVTALAAVLAVEPSVSTALLPILDFSAGAEVDADAAESNIAVVVLGDVESADVAENRLSAFTTPHFTVFGETMFGEIVFGEVVEVVGAAVPTTSAVVVPN